MIQHSKLTSLSTVSIIALLINMGVFNGKAFAESSSTTLNSAANLKEVTKQNNIFVDENGVEAQNVITKYETKTVTKYYDAANGSLIDADDKTEGATYILVKVTEAFPKYYSMSLADKEYGSGNEEQGFVWQKNREKTYELIADNDSPAKDIVVKYSNENSSPRLENPIGDINYNFVDNTLTSGTQSVYGASIYNKDNQIGVITGDFVNNTMPSVQNTLGTALYNENGTIEAIKGNFVNNTMDKPTRSSSGYGGALYNTNNAEIKNIEGSFIGNKIVSKSGSTNGGAIFNGSYTNSNTGAIIGDITGDFIGNGVRNSSAASDTYGGAIYNSKKSSIGHINGNFIGNYAIHTGTYNRFPRGGAIYNNIGSITGITGDFIGNYLFTEQGGGDGGAIYNAGDYSSLATIGNIEGDFIGNYIQSNGGGNGNSTYGGAIYNYKGKIGSISGDFTKNYINTTVSNAYGGAIANYSTSSVIDSINGNFTDNYIKSSKYAYGGAIYNSLATAGTVSGTFSNNYAKADTAYGGAIANNYGGVLTIKNSSFYNNHADSTAGNAFGGAIYSQYDLNIVADNGKKNEFSGNYTNSNGTIDNNAIYLKDYNDWNGDNKDHLPVLTLTANNNSNITFWDNINGVDGYKVNINGDGTGSVSLYNDVKNANIAVDNVTVDLANGIVHDYEVKSLTSTDTAKYNIDVNLADKTSDRLVLLNPSENSGNVVKLGMLNFIDKYQGTPVQVQVIKSENDNIQLALSDNIVYKNNIDNTVYNDTIVEDAGAIQLATKDTTNDSIQINGVIYDTLDSINSLENDDRNFIFRTTDKYFAHQDLSETGAGTLNIKGLEGSHSVLDGNGHSLFKLNDETTLNIDNIKIEKASSVISGTNANAVVNISNSEITNNSEGINFAGKLHINGNTSISENGEGIKMTSDTSEIFLDAADGDISVNDKISGVDGSQLFMQNGNINLYQKVSGMDVNLDGANLKLHDNLVLDGLNVNIGPDSMLNLANGRIGTAAFKSLKLNGDVDLAVDVDLANKSMDRITADTFDNTDNNPTARANDTGNYKINVSEMNLLSDANEEKTSILFADELLKDKVTTSVSEVAYSPIYKYDVTYDSLSGNFLFTRSEKNNFNPSVMAAPVAAQVGGYLSQLHSYDEAFADMDMYMSSAQKERRAATKKRFVAYCDCGKMGYYTMNNFCNDRKLWVRPYATFEDVSLKNGPKVSNTAYGTYMGGESQLYTLGYGWDGMVGAYLGYNGSRQEYDNISISQNGGTLGVVGMAYKDNFFAGLTVNAGASRAKADTKYGDENFTILTSGIAGKTGYNFEFHRGDFIIQPNLLMSYSYVNTLGYTNAAGTKIDSDNLNAVQIEPGVKFIGNLIYGWQPYASLSVVETLMDETKFEADNIALPELSVKTYVRYGIGIRKKWDRHLDGFAQTYFTSGGRTGADIKLGIRWMF